MPKLYTLDVRVLYSSPLEPYKRRALFQNVELFLRVLYIGKRTLQKSPIYRQKSPRGLDISISLDISTRLDIHTFGSRFLGFSFGA